MRISKTVMAVGGVVVAAAAIGFTNPTTVHALAAALVQVTNTAANPVVTQGVDRQAAQIVNLVCDTDGEQLGVCKTVTSGPAATETNYQIPAGSIFVITSVDISVPSPSSCPYFEFGFSNSDVNGNGTGGAGLPFFVPPPPSTGETYHFAYSSGWKISPIPPYSYIGMSGGASGCAFSRVTGYTTVS